MTLFERVRSALQTEYDIREELGRGGMGAVFLARDRALDRPVAVKVLLPERATARAVERFLREARALAAVEDPRVLQVHRAGEAAGLYYYVMEHAAGETLATRLERGPLDAASTRRLAADLLGALGAIHEAGIVHRDVKPSNIFLVGGRAVLGDFGIAVPSGEDGTDRLTRGGEVVGTPRYLAPEQRRGESSASTDVYAAALVLYEACTGTGWRDAAGAGPPWRSVPRGLRAPLKRALAPDPEHRWADVRAFRAAVANGGRRRRWLATAALAVIIAAVVLARALDGGADDPVTVSDLAVVPFEVAGGQPPQLGRDLAILTTLALEDLPTLRVVPAARAAQPEPAGSDAPTALSTVFAAGGTLFQRGDRLELRLVVEDSTGQRAPERIVRGPVDDQVAMAESVALALVRIVQPRLASSFRGLEALSGTPLQAVRSFILGEHAFHRNAWSAAEEHYRTALEIDSTFALAEWRLWNVWRWKLTGVEVVDLERLYRDHGDQLGTVDRALLAATATGPGSERIRALETVARRFGHDGYTQLLLADELYHRGPLVGRPLEEAVEHFEAAAARDPYLAPAYEHGLLALMRLGRRDEAREFNQRLQRTAAPRAADEPVHFPTLLAQAYLERFEPEQAGPGREQLFDLSSPVSLGTAEFAARMGLAVDLPGVQLELGRRLAAVPGATDELRANGHLAQALALMVLGRPAEALPHFDDAAELLGSADLALEAAEWRVLLPALGIDGIGEDEVARGRRRLEAAAAGGADPGGRASWALAIDAYGSGNVPAGRRWRRAIPTPADSGAPDSLNRLDRLAEAWEALALSDYRRALTRSAPLLAEQFLPRGGDPFWRAALHLLRARAYEGLGERAGARAERRWSENQDIARVLGGRIQAVEVDWALSVHSDGERARLALAQADTAVACRLLRRVVRLWEAAEPPLAAVRSRAVGQHDALCS